MYWACPRKRRVARLRSLAALPVFQEHIDRLLGELFRDWLEITNSIFFAGPAGLRQQMDVWFSIEEEPPPRGTNASRST
jgi:hypothetical protein